MSDSPAQQLRIERRSFIIGTVVVWWVIVVTAMLLFVNMEPQVFAAPRATTYQAAMARLQKAPPLTTEQQLVLELIFLVGAVALFFLNWRFSYLMRRPRGAFGAPGTFSAGRWLWWIALSLNSYFFFPQVVVTPVLAVWGSQEIARLAALPPPSSGDSPEGPTDGSHDGSHEVPQ